MRPILLLFLACILVLATVSCDRGDATATPKVSDQDKSKFDELVEKTWTVDFVRADAIPWLREPGHSFYGLDTDQVVRFAQELETETGSKSHVTRIDQNTALTLLIRLPDNQTQRETVMSKKNQFAAAIGKPLKVTEGHRWLAIEWNSSREANQPH